MSDFDDCAWVVEVLPEYLGDRVSAEVKRGMESHLEGCPECRARAETIALLQQASLPSPDPERWDRLVDGVLDEAAKPIRRRRWTWGVAAAAVLALAGGLFFRAPSPELAGGGLEAVAREVAELSEAEAAAWTVGVDPVHLVPAGSDDDALNEDELRDLIREVGRT